MEKNWSASRTERSHAPWMSWSTSWNFQGQERHQMGGSVMDRTSSLSLRSLQKTGGLFDKGISEDFDETSPSITEESSRSKRQTENVTKATGTSDDDNLNNADLSHIFGDAEDLLLSSLDEMAEEAGEGGDFLSAFSPTSFMMQGQDMDFEEFTDLSHAILGVDAEDLPVTSGTMKSLDTTLPTPSVAESSTSAKRINRRRSRAAKTSSTQDHVAVTTKCNSPRKRKPQEAKETSADSKVPPLKKMLSIGINHDHNDYTKKTEIQASMDESEAESVTSTSTEVVSKTGTSAGTSQNKYKMRREKNNVASRRSRQCRKQKFINMEDQAERLEKDNAEMREKIELMEVLAKSLKQHLVSTMVAK